jgi:hypothetical protein
MGLLRGVLGGTLALTALQTVVGTDQASGRVTGLLRDLNRLLNSALSPNVPAIPDLRGRRSGTATPLPAAVFGGSGGGGSFPTAPPRSGDDRRTPTGTAGGLQPEFASRLAALIAASGGRIRIGSGFRSYTEQATLYDRWIRRVPGQARAAKPGTSKHERGEAADLIYTGNGRAWAHANAARFGLHFPLRDEPWHIERR